MTTISEIEQSFTCKVDYDHKGIPFTITANDLGHYRIDLNNTLIHKDFGCLRDAYCYAIGYIEGFLVCNEGVSE